MCFNRYLAVLFCSCCLIFPSAAVVANPATSGWQLQMTPQHCVTLEQGRTCYATINLHWQAPQHSDVCLLLSGEVLQCWQQQRSAQWQFEFAAANSQTLTLQVGSQIMASQRVTVSWVQKRRSNKRHWRLF